MRTLWIYLLPMVVMAGNACRPIVGPPPLPNPLRPVLLP